MHRRQLITGIISLVASPAIVKATSLMQMRGLKLAMSDMTFYANPRTISHIVKEAFSYDYQGRFTATINLAGGDYTEWCSFIKYSPGSILNIA